MANSDIESDSAVEDRMAVLRSRLERDARACQQARERWTDWRTHVRAHPWIACGAAAAIGYALVPGRRRHDAHAHHGTSQGSENGNRSPGLLGSLASAAARRAAQHALTLGAAWAMGQLRAAQANGAAMSAHYEPRDDSANFPSEYAYD